MTQMEFIPLKTPDGRLYGHARVKDGFVRFSLKEPARGRAVIFVPGGSITAGPHEGVPVSAKVLAAGLEENGRLLCCGLSRQSTLTLDDVRRRVMALSNEAKRTPMPAVKKRTEAADGTHAAVVKREKAPAHAAAGVDDEMPEALHATGVRKRAGEAARADAQVRRSQPDERQETITHQAGVHGEGAEPVSAAARRAANGPAREDEILHQSGKAHEPEQPGFGAWEGDVKGEGEDEAPYRAGVTKEPRLPDRRAPERDAPNASPRPPRGERGKPVVLAGGEKKPPAAANDTKRMSPQATMTKAGAEDRAGRGVREAEADQPQPLERQETIAHQAGVHGEGAEPASLAARRAANGSARMDEILHQSGKAHEPEQPGFGAHETGAEDDGARDARSATHDARVEEILRQSGRSHAAEQPGFGAHESTVKDEGKKAAMAAQSAAPDSARKEKILQQLRKTDGRKQPGLRTLEYGARGEANAFSPLAAGSGEPVLSQAEEGAHAAPPGGKKPRPATQSAKPVFSQPVRAEKPLPEAAHPRFAAETAEAFAPDAAKRPLTDQDTEAFFALLKRSDEVYRSIYEPAAPRREADPLPFTRSSYSNAPAWHSEVDALLGRAAGEQRVGVPNPFPHIFPNAAFIKIVKNGGIERLEGDWRRGGERFMIHAVPGSYSPMPPPELAGYTRYIRSRAGGFWVKVVDV